MLSWAMKRRTLYLGGLVLTLLIIISIPAFFLFYKQPTCSDGEHNGDEAGVDCGGSCALFCPFQVIEPSIIWSRAFEIKDGVYSAVAYVENPNTNAATEEVNYNFELYDNKNILIAERKGRTFLPQGTIIPIFEGGITVGDRMPARTFFDFISVPRWYRVENEVNPLRISDKSLTGENTSPRVSARLSNTSVRDVSDIEVVATIFNALGNAIASSRTIVDTLQKNESIDLVFTWPKPLTKELEACTIPVDVVLLLDVSGSMNDDNADPPQPLTNAKDAAEDFIKRLSEIDRSGIVSFASTARLEQNLAFNHENSISAISSLNILPSEETGSTNMGDALKIAGGVFSPRVEMEGDYREVVVLLTDGKANAPKDPGGEEYALDQVSILKNRGFSLYTIGLGDKVNREFLSSVASVGQQFYEAATSRDLSRIYSQISDAICERGPAVIEVIPRSFGATFGR